MSGASINVTQSLQAAAAMGLERLDAQLLLLHAMGRGSAGRAWLVAHDTDDVPPPLWQLYMSLCTRRIAGEPVAYLTGSREFHGLSLQVDRRVLVPRPDTETLVEWALAALDGTPTPQVLDLGTGSGAIALAIKHARPDATVTAVDASPSALEVAAANASRLGLDVRFTQGSWLQGVSGHYHAILSNPPYISENDPHLAGLAHEPLEALASGPDGLDDIRLIVTQAPAHLLPGGWLLLEHGWDQAAAVRALLADASLENVVSCKDLAGIERCSGGKLPARG